VPKNIADGIVVWILDEMLASERACAIEIPVLDRF
jgi:hypothetical protein